LHSPTHSSCAVGHSRLLVQLLQLFMPRQVNSVLFQHTRSNNDSRKWTPPSRLHGHSLPPVLHASPATAGMAWEGALLLTVPVPTLAMSVTGPEPLDAQPRRYNATIATRLSTTTDVARKRTRDRTALQAP
ncbi:hypothetical protein SK128_003365, partial [Halocaridina rubra]